MIKNSKIVIIDDSKISRSLIRNYLESAGYSVAAEGENATQAIQIYQHMPIDLFILDIVMPEVSGLELLRELFDQKYSGKVIMVSSLYAEDFITQAISLGASEYLKKPLDKKSFLDSVEKILHINLADKDR